MLSIVTTPEGRAVQMLPVTPMIYLDHWALRQFSRDTALTSRFVNVLRSLGGTLALSWLNLGEFATVSMVESRREAEAFVESVLPAVFCIDVDLSGVDDREKSGDPVPHADRAAVPLLLNGDGSGDRPFTAKGLFEPLFNPELAETKDRLAVNVQGRLESLREEYHSNALLADVVHHAEHPDALAGTTRTRAIVRTLAGTFFPDLRRRITLNDAIDFLHAAIPIAYCQVVLLDGGMRDHVERARARFRDTGITLATVFSGQDGLGQLLDLLEKRWPARTRGREGSAD